MDWIKVSEQLPPNNINIETKIDGNNAEEDTRELYFCNENWYGSGGSYVYNKPTHWRYLNEEQKNFYELSEEKRMEILRNSHIFYCSCFSEKPTQNRECYFYHDEKHMGGSIPTCNYFDKLGYCPCDDYKKYIKRSEVFKMVKEHVDNRRL